MKSRKKLLTNISRNAVSINNVLIDAKFINSGLFNLEDIKFIVKNRLAVIQATVDELMDMEK